MSSLAQHVLNKSIVDYTTTLCREAFAAPENSGARHRGQLALEFFTSLLPSSTTEGERDQLKLFETYRVALNDTALARELLQSHQVEFPTRSSTAESGTVRDLTPVQQVLSLPDTLDLIISQIPTLSKSDRHTLHAASLTSRTFHNAAQLRLWKKPRDLDTVDQQVQFAFGTAISAGLSDSLGNYVSRLRIRIMPGGWNTPLVEKITSLCPAISELMVHWGDTEDELDPITTESLTALNNILTSLPNLKHLQLFKYSPTPEYDSQLQLPKDSHIPYSKLESLQLYGFHWYWKSISEGLGSVLKELDIGLGTQLAAGELAALAPKLSSLVTLRLSCGTTISDLRLILDTARSMECFELKVFSEFDDTYGVDLISLLVNAPKLKKISLGGISVEPAQIDSLAASTLPLEEIELSFEEGVDVEQTLLPLLKSKRDSLKTISLSHQGLSLLQVSDEFVLGLAACTRLKTILLDLDDLQPKLTSSAVESLLKHCPNLELTDSLECIVRGNSVYEAEYKARLEKERDAEIEELEEDVLGN